MLSDIAAAANVYEVGNSLTYALDTQTMSVWAAIRGHSYSAGLHAVFGTGLNYIWSNPDYADASLEPYGLFGTALPNYAWDAITLQPYRDPLAGPTGDLQSISNFVELALSNGNNANAQFYLYQRWPPNSFDESFDYAALWDTPYMGEMGTTTATRDYYDQLADAVNSTDLGLSKPMLMIPNGEVLYALNKLINAGEIPDLSSISQLYDDQVHLNEIGRFVLLSTVYSTIFGESSLGLPNPYPANVSSDLAAAIQSTAWQVVAGHEYSGVLANGDFDGSGFVDHADYDRWTLYFDLGLSDTAKYTVWRDHLGAGHAPPLELPEPSSATLAFFAWLLLGSLRAARSWYTR